jgi:hypothetical protein
MNIPKHLRGKLAILLLRSNVPASVVRHDTLGKRSLIRNPTRIMTYQSASSFQGVICELNAIRSFFVVEVV